MYDYYFFHNPHRSIEKNCEFVLCQNSILFKRFKNICLENNKTDILEYMLYNASGDTGLPAHYSCCMSYEGGHVCNNMPIMIGSLLENKILNILMEMLKIEMNIDKNIFFDKEYLHKIYTGSFLVNGTFYYSVFRESNNNKICHNSKSKSCGNQTVVYFYDKLCNRGIKLYTNSNGDLMINGRDGNHISNVTSEILFRLYKDCMDKPEVYSTDINLIKGMFKDIKKEGIRNIDRFKNKMYTNYTIGLNTFLNKIPAKDLSNPMCINAIMGGKINLGISQRLKYPPSKSDAKKQNEQKLKMCTGKSNDYLIESQRRRNNNNKKNETGENEINSGGGGGGGGGGEENITNVLGSRIVKSQSFIERMEQGEKVAPSIFNQISASYLPHIKILSATVQKLQVENVHAESSKTISKDAFGFICMKYMGNIGTAGKNMLFTDRVVISFGNVNLGISHIEDYLGLNVKSQNNKGWLFDYSSNIENGNDHNYCNSNNNNDGVDDDGVNDTNIYIVINNGLTKYALLKSYVYTFMIQLKFECEEFLWTKLVGNYLHIYIYEGMPFLKYTGDDNLMKIIFDLIDVNVVDTFKIKNYIYFCRSELEFLCEAVLKFGHFKINEKKHLSMCYKYLVEDRDYINIYTLGNKFKRFNYTSNSNLNKLYILKDNGIIKLLDDNVNIFINKDDNTFMELVNVFISYSLNNNILTREMSRYESPTASNIINCTNNIMEIDYENVQPGTSSTSSPSSSIYSDCLKNEKSTLNIDDGNVNNYNLNETNENLILDEFMEKDLNLYNQPTGIQSLLASQMDQYTNFTAPAKRSVSVNARKSACINIYYQKASDLLRGFTIFVDPDEYENRLAKKLNVENGIPIEKTLSEFKEMRNDKRNCPGNQTLDYDMKNFYMLKTVFADISGFNVEDANVIDESVDLCMSFSYSFSLTFVDKTERGVNVIINENAKNSSTVCQFDDEGNPISVLFLVCIISINSLDLKKPNLIHFPPFRKLSIIVDLYGNYYVYYIRNDAVLMKSIKKIQELENEKEKLNNDKYLVNKQSSSCPFPYLYKCRKNDSLTKTIKLINTRAFSFNTDNMEKIINIDVRVHGDVDKYDGVKVINSFGQKGLAVIKDLKPYFRENANSCIPVQLVMNNCSFVSRQPIGQLLQMKNNLYETIYSTSGEPVACGFSSIFFNENEPTVTTCLVRLDEMMRSVLITLGLSSFQNVKSCTDNIYNPNGLMLSPQVRQIIGLYRCMGVSYNINGDNQRYYAKKSEIQHLINMFEDYISKMRKKIRISNYTNQLTMFELPEILGDFRKINYLKSQNKLSIFCDGKKKIYNINLLEKNEIKTNKKVYTLNYYDDNNCKVYIVVKGNPCVINLIIDECELYNKYKYDYNYDLSLNSNSDDVCKNQILNNVDEFDYLNDFNDEYDVNACMSPTYCPLSPTYDPS